MRSPIQTALWLDAADTAGGALPTYLASACSSSLPWIIAQAMTATTRALYTRGDLDLVFASPVSARAVLAARAFAIASDGVASVAILLLPLANMNALLGHRRWLALYPALAATWPLRRRRRHCLGAHSVLCRRAAPRPPRLADRRDAGRRLLRSGPASPAACCRRRSAPRSWRRWRRRGRSASQTLASLLSAACFGGGGRRRRR